MVIDAAAVAMRGTVAAATPRALLLQFYPEAAIAPMEAVDPAAPPMPAEVNHGVWIARCACGADPAELPAPGCIVWVDAPLGWCIRCGNAVAAGRWRPIALPPPDERAAIEAALAARPDPATRNWRPGETVDDLVRENDEHELGPSSVLGHRVSVPTTDDRGPMTGA